MASPTPSEMRPNGLPPVTIMAAAVVAGLLVVGTVLALARSQPWLGLALEVPAMRVTKAEGPATEVLLGTVVKEITGGGESMELEPLDLVTEPDGAMGDYATYRR
ncbi:MAG: hypothetical protein KDN05_19350, partial [Verrucomicrobiae bacterium]|nr:hypothetical protein [Verrucomicrobiae bacterium]